MNDTYGHGSQMPFAYFDHDMHCWRTSQATLVWDLDRFLETWPRSGMTLDGIAYQLQPSARLTDATAYLLSLHAATEQTEETVNCSDRGQHRGLWPTPLASDWKRQEVRGNRKGTISGAVWRSMWPTATANGWGSTGHQQMLQQRVDAGEITEDEKRQMVQGHGGKLNPTWIEWLMGFPTGWTDLED